MAVAVALQRFIEINHIGLGLQRCHKEEEAEEEEPFL